MSDERSASTSALAFVQSIIDSETNLPISNHLQGEKDNKTVGQLITELSSSKFNGQASKIQQCCVLIFGENFLDKMVESSNCEDLSDCIAGYKNKLKQEECSSCQVCDCSKDDLIVFLQSLDSKVLYYPD